MQERKKPELKKSTIIIGVIGMAISLGMVAMNNMIGFIVVNVVTLPILAIVQSRKPKYAATHDVDVDADTGVTEY